MPQQRGSSSQTHFEATHAAAEPVEYIFIERLSEQVFVKETPKILAPRNVIWPVPPAVNFAVTLAVPAVAT